MTQVIYLEIIWPIIFVLSSNKHWKKNQINISTLFRTIVLRYHCHQTANKANTSQPANQFVICRPNVRSECVWNAFLSLFLLCKSIKSFFKLLFIVFLLKRSTAKWFSKFYITITVSLFVVFKILKIYWIKPYSVERWKTLANKETLS